MDTIELMYSKFIEFISLSEDTFKILRLSVEKKTEKVE